MTDWVNTTCPCCGGPAKRETDTMPQWAGSSWYFLRYCDPHNDKELISKEAAEYWTPVDWYNGGMEHTTLHLLYSRFWHKFLYDIGVVPTSEPYQKRTSHGMILGENGEKMSKSRGNVVNPDEIVDTYGADQIICGKNATRRMVNNQMRTLLGYGAEPQDGDKIICLKNYWDASNECGDPLINGMIGTLVNPKIGTDQGVLGRPMKADFLPEFADETAPFDFAMRDLDMDYKLMTQGNPTFARDAKPIFRNGKKLPFPMEFDYGYCITCHKSQGSQFNKVLLFEEVLNRETHARWLYTAITRAVEKIVIVKQR